MTAARKLRGPALLREGMASIVFGSKLTSCTGFRIEFTAHVPPVPHQSVRLSRGKDGRLRGNKNYDRVRAYKDAVQGYAMDAKIKYACRRRAMTGHEWPLNRVYRVVLRVYMDSARRCDVDNFCKPVLDALNDVMWLDDSQVQVVTCAKFVDRENPRVTVLCEVIG